MPAPFKQIRREQFAALLEKFDFQRRINAVHMHHTWRPEHSDYEAADGHRTIVGMFLTTRRRTAGSDIAQHITIAPDGTIWLGPQLEPAAGAARAGTTATRRSARSCSK